MEKKYKVGYTTGVFDLFHIWHLNLLKRAKAQCEHLIVGVSTDELVREYKHKTPVIPFEERKAIVAAIRYVDQVVPQVNRDKVSALEKYHFDVMFVGNDWKGSGLFTKLETQFQEKNVDICYFPYTTGTSSTMIQEVLYQMTNL